MFRHTPQYPATHLKMYVEDQALGNISLRAACYIASAQNGPWQLLGEEENSDAQ